jgi:indolepyruvate ferredoxin oxidoreductase beta subunit
MGKNCLLCGVGGQGVVLASKLIAYAAMEKGLNVRTSETIGMSQRGGSVVTHVRMGETVHSPMIPKGAADVIMAFEPAEAVRNLSYLKKDGVMVVEDVKISDYLLPKDYILKEKLFRWKYGFSIKRVYKPNDVI